jgi:hypothetical protein
MATYELELEGISRKSIKATLYRDDKNQGLVSHEIKTHDNGFIELYKPVREPSSDHDRALVGEFQRLASEYNAQVIIEAMHDYNRYNAPGSECGEWGQFIEDFRQHTGTMPWRVEQGDMLGIDQKFFDYWRDISTTRL